MKLLTEADSLIPTTRMVLITATMKTAGRLSSAPVRLRPACAQPARPGYLTLGTPPGGRLGQMSRQVDAELIDETHQVSRPADPDRRRARGVFQHQVPADDPGDQLAHRGVGVGVRAAGHRHRARHFRVAEPGEGAGDAGHHEGDRHRRAGVQRRGLPVRTKMPAPMMAPMPSSGEIERRPARASGERSLVASASARSAATDLVAQSSCGRILEYRTNVKR